jgi:hypothetical protein
LSNTNPTIIHSELDLTSEYISAVNRTQLTTTELPVELVELLKHAGVDGKKLTWDLQVNASAVSVKLLWIKAEKPIATIGEVTRQATKKKYLSPSTRKRNTQRLNQWKAKRNEAVVYTRVNAEAQTENLTTLIDETTQTDQQHSHE